MEGTTIDEMISNLTTALLSTAAHVAARAKEKRVLRGWSATNEVRRGIHVT